MTITNMITVTTRTEFIHRYKNAPDEVEFLRDWHRHELHIELGIEVTHEDRELEFILVKRDLQDYLEKNKEELRYVEKSCESLGNNILDYLAAKHGNRKMFIRVLEDGENGSLTLRGF